MASSMPTTVPSPHGQDKGQLVADALSLVIERCPEAINNVQDLCSLLQTSTAIQAALQRSRGYFTINIDADQVSEFAAWLPAHAGLVEGLRVLEVESEGTASDHHCDDANNLAPSVVLAVAEALKAAAAAGPSGRLPLQLTAYASTCLVVTEVVAALPRSLTRLNFGFADSGPCVFGSSGPAGFGAALAQLTSLQDLQLPGRFKDVWSIAPSWLPALTQLTRLWATVAPAEGVQGTYLPPSLRWLFVVLVDVNGITDVHFDCGHLSEVRHLNVACGVGSKDHAVATQHTHTSITLPSHLTELCLLGPFSDVLGLEQQPDLQVCRLTHGILEIHQVIQVLRALPPLTTVEMSAGARKYGDGELPWVHTRVSAVDAQRALDVVAATGCKLTALILNGYYVEPAALAAPLDAMLDAAPTWHGVVWHEELQQLSKLQQLRLRFPFAAPADAMGLTALTALSELCLRESGPGVDDGVVAAVCASLTSLRSLHITSAGISRASVVFAAVGSLTGLEYLSLSAMITGALVVSTPFTVKEADLALLHPLVHLKDICLPRQVEQQCSRTAVSELFAALVSLRVDKPATTYFSYM